MVAFVLIATKHFACLGISHVVEKEHLLFTCKTMINPLLRCHNTPSPIGASSVALQEYSVEYSRSGGATEYQGV